MAQKNNKLTTDFIKVATAGKTMDGREIKTEWLEEIVAHYDIEEYTAKIFIEHAYWYGNQGTVAEVKLGNDKKGRVCLFAKLIPEPTLIAYTRANQYCFPSISIGRHPDGYAYLLHVAAVQEEASIGTDKLEFSAEGFTALDASSNGFFVEKQTKIFADESGLFGHIEDAADAFAASPEPSHALFKNDIIDAIKSMFSTIKNSNPPENLEDYDMTKQELDTLNEKLDVCIAFAKKLESIDVDGLNAVASQFSKDQDGGTDAAPADGTADETQSISVDAAAFSALKDQVEALTIALEVAKTTESNTATDFGAQTGGDKSADDSDL